MLLQVLCRSHHTGTRPACAVGDLALAACGTSVWQAMQGDGAAQGIFGFMVLQCLN